MPLSERSYPRAAPLGYLAKDTEAATVGGAWRTEQRTGPSCAAPQNAAERDGGNSGPQCPGVHGTVVNPLSLFSHFRYVLSVHAYCVWSSVGGRLHLFSSQEIISHTFVYGQALSPVDEGDVYAYATGRQLAAAITAMTLRESVPDMEVLLEHLPFEEILPRGLLAIHVAPAAGLVGPTRPRTGSGTSAVCLCDILFVRCCCFFRCSRTVLVAAAEYLSLC